MQDQINLFKAISQKFPNRKLAAEIGELLGICSDSAYRRISGETELKMTEQIRICKNYNLSLEGIISGKTEQGAFFQNTPVDIADQDSYVNYMTQQLNSLIHGSKDAKGMEAVFTAQDIPFYHFVKYPELAFFRLFVWNDVLNPRAISYCKFCDELKKEKIIPVYNQIYQAFLQTPSKEIWTKHTVYSTLRMLEYYFETGAFERNDTILLLLSQLENLLDTVWNYAESGQKENTPFELYLCSVNLENNFLMIRNGEDLSCIVQLFANKMVETSNENLCAEIQKWIDSLLLKSKLISGGAAFRERHRLFESAKRKIKDLKTKAVSKDAIKIRRKP